MNNLYYTLCIVIILLSSCKNREREAVGRFDKTFKIYAKKLNTDTHKLNSVGKMILFEDQECIIKENYIGESLLDKIFYNLDSIVVFATKGNGPDEYIMPRLMQKLDKTGIRIIDLLKKK